jgi:hypothetical protein
MDSKFVTKLSKDGGRLMRSTMYTSSSSIFIIENYYIPINKLPKPMLGKHHAHLEFPKVKVATIKLFHDFQRLHLEGWHFVEHKC